MITVTGRSIIDSGCMLDPDGYISKQYLIRNPTSPFRLDAYASQEFVSGLSRLTVTTNETVHHAKGPSKSFGFRGMSPPRDINPRSSEMNPLNASAHEHSMAPSLTLLNYTDKTITTMSKDGMVKVFQPIGLGMGDPLNGSVFIVENTLLNTEEYVREFTRSDSYLTVMANRLEALKVKSNTLRKTIDNYKYADKVYSKYNSTVDNGYRFSMNAIGISRVLKLSPLDTCNLLSQKDLFVEEFGMVISIKSCREITLNPLLDPANDLSSSIAMNKDFLNESTSSVFVNDPEKISSKLYMNFFGSVISVVVIRDSNKDPGIYINTPTKNGERETKLIPLGDRNLVKYGIYNTWEEAKNCMGVTELRKQENDERKMKLSEKMEQDKIDRAIMLEEEKHRKAMEKLELEATLVEEKFKRDELSTQRKDQRDEELAISKQEREIEILEYKRQLDDIKKEHEQELHIQKMKVEDDKRRHDLELHRIRTEVEVEKRMYEQLVHKQKQVSETSKQGNDLLTTALRTISTLLSFLSPFISLFR